jgi:hypothetical protein
MLLRMGGETPETCWATHKRQVINLWNCCILLVELFESYDDAQTCERQRASSFSRMCVLFLKRPSIGRILYFYPQSEVGKVSFSKPEAYCKIHNAGKIFSASGVSGSFLVIFYSFIYCPACTFCKSDFLVKQVNTAHATVINRQVVHFVIFLKKAYICICL